MARTAARRDADAHRDSAAEHAFLHCKTIHIGLLCRLEGGHERVRRIGDIPKPVEDKKDNLVVVGKNKIVHHVASQFSS